MRHTLYKFLYFCIIGSLSSTQVQAAKFSIVVLPDTQFYAELNPVVMEAQTQWIVDNRIKENIIYVAHLGDLKDDQLCDNVVATDGSGRTEWEVVEDTMAILEDPVTTGLPDGIPYGITAGNHDFDQVASICPNYTTDRPLNSYNNGSGSFTGLGPARFAGRSYYGGSETVGSNENNYTLFEFCGIEFMAINLAYYQNVGSTGGPDDPAAALAWAEGLMTANPNRKVIVTSHYTLNEHTAGTSTDFGPYGARIYDELSDNPNLFLMLGAHTRGEAWRVESRTGMDDVHIIMSNYQDTQYPTGTPDFGNLTSFQPGDSGFMRIMRFDTETDQVSVETFSPAIPSLGRPNDLVSTNNVADGSQMDRFTASNFSFPFNNSVSVHPSIAILMDTSGSMNWGVDGTTSVPADEQRIAYAREAATAFISMMLDVPANENNASFGIAAFPDHPTSSCSSPGADVITAMTQITPVSRDTAVDTTIPGLLVSGGTPLMTGVDTSIGMFGAGNQCRSIIMLTDGYHNCPNTVLSTDPVVDTLVSDLNSNNVRLYTVGFGEPGDVDNLLHRRLADDTTPDGASSQFYDVTADLGYNPAVPASWTTTAKPALDSVFKEILSSVMGLETAIDPVDVINQGEVKKINVPINEHDRKLGFYVSWRTPQRDYLSFKVYDSNGDRVFIRESGVKQIKSDTYTILSVDKRYLQRPGKVTGTPWRLEITTSDQLSNNNETFQYSVIMDSALKLNSATASKDYYAGDKITLTAQLTERGNPVTGLKDVQVVISAPEDGQGNWLSENQVTTSQLQKVPLLKGKETLLPFQRKAIYLNDIANIPFPAKKSPKTLVLYDDGSHGDQLANDGIYTNSFASTKKEGVYSFYFQSNGTTLAGNRFSREQLVQSYLPVRVVAEAINVDIVALAINDLKPYVVTLRPKDKLGNYLGPGHAGLIRLSANKGRFRGELIDKLDGSYQQTLYVPKSVADKDVQVSVSVGTATKIVNVAKALRHRKAYAASLHIGLSSPHGQYNNLYDGDINLGLDLEVPFKKQLSVIGDLQYSRFDSRQAGLADASWLSLTAGAKYQFSPSAIYRPFVVVGAGYYEPDSGSGDLGTYVRLGVERNINTSWRVELGADYNTVFTSGSDINYSLFRLGLIYQLP